MNSPSWSVLRDLSLCPISISTFFFNNLKVVNASSLDFINIIHINLVQSSTSNRKYLFHEGEAGVIGPQRSPCSSSSGSFARYVDTNEMEVDVVFLLGNFHTIALHDLSVVIHQQTTAWTSPLVCKNSNGRSEHATATPFPCALSSYTLVLLVVNLMCIISYMIFSLWQVTSVVDHI